MAARENKDWLKDLNLPRPTYTSTLGAAYCGDSTELMSRLPAGSIDLVVTSPPFALRKKKEYGNVDAKDYVEWFRSFSDQFMRVLKDKGSLVIDIGGTWNPGVPTRPLYQFELLVFLVKQGFNLCQDFYWYNPAKLPSPAEWVNVRRIRVKDAVNTVWWLSKSEFPKADNKQVLKEYSNSMKSLLENGYKAKIRPSGWDISPNFSKNRGGAIPPNLLCIANTESNSLYLRSCREAGMKPHPARYPRGLPEFFIKFLSGPDDIVLDPFAGSNVTGEVAQSLKRRWLSFELVDKYVEGSKFRFRQPPAKPKNSRRARKKKEGGNRQTSLDLTG